MSDRTLMQTAGQPRRRSIGAIWDENLPARESLLGTWLTQRHLSMVYAPAGCGKSMFTMSIALAVAGGGSLFGWQAGKARRVLLVDGEMDVLDLKERSEQLLSAIPDADPALIRENLDVFAHQDQRAGVRFPDLATGEGRTEVLRQAMEHRAELVILDNFSTLATVIDENAASSFDPIIDLMRDMKQAGMAVILVHHTRKNANGEGSYRGTSKMAVVFNSIISLRHPGDIPSKHGADFELSFEKFRGLRDETVRPLRATLEHHSEAGTATWRCEASSEAVLDELVQRVKSLEYPTQDALAEAMGVSKGQVSKLRRKAIAAGLISEGDWTGCLKMAADAAREEDAEADPYGLNEEPTPF